MDWIASFLVGLAILSVALLLSKTFLWKILIEKILLPAALLGGFCGLVWGLHEIIYR